MCFTELFWNEKEGFTLGEKQTDTFQEMIGFLKSREKCNLLMVLINIVVFIVLEFLGSTTDVQFMLRHGAMYVPAIVRFGKYGQLFTSMFLHFGIEHLLYNMLLLVFIGDTLEKTVGKGKYLLIYLGGGLMGNLLSMAKAMQTEVFHVSAGASGAIFAVLGALCFLAVKNRKTMNSAESRRLIMMAVLSLLQGFTETGTDNMAHLGGFAGGFLLCFLFTIHRKKQAEDL